MIGPETEHGVERLARRGFARRERRPGTGQQFVAPARHELAVGQLQDANGQPLVLDGGVTGAGGNTKGLWGIAFGNGQGGAGTQTLFFASGPNDESDGVFGMVNVDPAGG